MNIITNKGLRKSSDEIRVDILSDNNNRVEIIDLSNISKYDSSLIKSINSLNINTYQEVVESRRGNR